MVINIFGSEVAKKHLGERAPVYRNLARAGTLVLGVVAIVLLWQWVDDPSMYPERPGYSRRRYPATVLMYGVLRAWMVFEEVSSKSGRRYLRRKH